MSSRPQPPPFSYAPRQHCVLPHGADLPQLSFWHGIRIGSYRKKAGLGYPKAYADNGDMDKADTEAKKKAMYLFNCTWECIDPDTQTSGKIED